MAIISALQKNSDGIQKRASGSFSTDAAGATPQTLTVGFDPRHIILHNLTDRISYEWLAGMASGTTLKTVAVGTRTLDTGDAAIQPGALNSNTGVITLSAAALIASKSFVWEAYA